MTITVAIYRLSAGEFVHIAPLPCRIIEEDVTSKIVAWLSHDVGISVEAIEFEQFVSSITIDVACCLFKIGNSRSLATEYEHGIHLLIVATDKQWHLSLLAIGKHIVRLLCPEVSVDVVYWYTLYASLLHKLFGRERTQFLNILAANFFRHF